MSRTQAIIYCRVSSERQAREGDGARSQEQRCRSYAQMQDYEMVRVFTDDGVSGALIDRPGIQKMLAFLRSQPSETVVIVDDISRIARDVMAHFQLKAAIRAAGGRVESPSFNFGDGASDELLETIMAATAQYGRKGNREQVLNRMRSRLEQGYWTFPPPLGYAFEKHSLHKKILVPSPAARTILGPALESFATGRLQTRRELGLHLQEQGFFADARPVSLKVLEDRIWRMMQLLPLYAGMLEYRPWRIERRPAQHEAILSPLGLARIEERLYRAERPIGIKRQDRNARFPLRNFLRCPSCGRPLTGSVSKGQFARYHCYYQRCPLYGKTYNADKKVEQMFRELLRSLTPTPELMEALTQGLPLVWTDRTAEQAQAVTALQKEAQSIQGEIQGYMRRLGRASDTLADEIERQVETLKGRELEVRRLLLEAEASVPRIEEAWRAVNTYFEHPLDLWESGSETEKKNLLRMVFTAPPVFERETGVNTANLSLPYRISRDFRHAKEGLVDLTGESWLELQTTILQWYEWIK